MQDQRVEAAMARIARALERIEQASRGSSAEAEELARLRSAHGLLRQRVESAIEEIDLMLGSAEAGSR